MTALSDPSLTVESSLQGFSLVTSISRRSGLAPFAVEDCINQCKGVGGPRLAEDESFFCALRDHDDSQ